MGSSVDPPGAGAGVRGGAPRADPGPTPGPIMGPTTGSTTGSTTGRPTSADLIACPECGVTAEVLDRFTLDSTAGPVEHLRIGCLSGHHFLMPAG